MIRNLTLLAVVVLLSFAVLDFGYTSLIINPQIERHREIEQSYRTPDDFLGHTLRPNYDGSASWGGHEYQIYTNDLGLKDSEARTVSPDATKPRMLFLGDSFTEGVGLPWETTFVGMVAEARPDLDVLNGGVIGYAPSFYLRKLKHLLDKGAAIDRVWVFIDISDIQDESRAFLDEPKQVEDAAPDTEETSPPLTFGRVKATIKENFFISVLVAKKLSQFGFQTLASLGLLGEGYSRNSVYWWSYDPRSNWPTRPNDAAYGNLGVDGSIDKARANMDEIHAILSARNIPLSVGVYPWPTQIHSGDLDSRHVRIWRDWCEGKCAVFLDLFPPFFEASKPLGTDFYEAFFIENDVHFNEAGNRLIADRILAVLPSPN